MSEAALKALDLFCGAGGATRGLQRAGFHVTGIDIKPQSRYIGDDFYEADALEYPLEGYDLIWASPPCQAYSIASLNMRRSGIEYPDLIDTVRDRLKTTNAKWVIENVPGSPLNITVKLNGWMFPSLKVIRERWFECSFFMLAPPAKRPVGLLKRGYCSVAGNGTQGWAYKLGIKWSTDYMRKAMGIEWMSGKELSQAVPPAYSEFIGLQAARLILRRSCNGV
jgi:DNA (cytosine-5)-methyltransferase 1